MCVQIPSILHKLKEEAFLAADKSRELTIMGKLNCCLRCQLLLLPLKCSSSHLFFSFYGCVLKCATHSSSRRKNIWLGRGIYGNNRRRGSTSSHSFFHLFRTCGNVCFSFFPPIKCQGSRRFSWAFLRLAHTSSFIYFFIFFSHPSERTLFASRLQLFWFVFAPFSVLLLLG